MKMGTILVFSLSLLLSVIICFLPDIFPEPKYDELNEKDTGQKTTSASVRYINNLPSGRIILCRDVRLSAGANFDSVVTIEKIPAIYADKITVQPIEDIGGFSDSIKQKIEDALIGRLVSKDSAYSIYQEIDSPFSSSFFEFGFARPTSFVVTDVSPSDYAIVTSATIIEFKDKAYSLTWNNPDYISEVRTREIRVFPIYPRGLPFVKFEGFQVARDALHAGDDFIGYFKDVKIIYDKAELTTERDIADEDLWGIVTRKEKARQNAEMTRFGNKQVSRYIERSKMATEDAFSSSLVEGSDSNAQSNGGATEADAK